MRVLLFEPEIPPNTGNVARLCAAMGVELDLVEPLGFRLDDRYLRRAGLDYWPHVRLSVWPNFESFVRRNGRSPGERLIMTSAKRGRSSRPLQDFAFLPDDCLVFGPETRGLPRALLESSPYCVHIPIRSMSRGGARCLNLSTSAGIVLYAALAACGQLDSLA